MKRNLAIFTSILRHAAFDRGIYLNASVSLPRKSFLDYLKPSALDEIAAYNIGEVPVSVLQAARPFPLSYRSSTVARASGSYLVRQLRAATRGEPYVLWLNSIYPIECNIAEAMAPRAEMVIFDSSDDMCTLEPPSDRGAAEQRLNRMLRISHKAVCVSESVSSQIDHPHKLVFRNCTAFESLQRVGECAIGPWLPKPSNAVYVGFIGSLMSDRADTELLGYLLQTFPKYTFLFAGWVDKKICSILEKYPNTAMIPEVPSDRLGDIIRSFDVGIVPHAINVVTQGNDLLKLLDYSACNVPVVSTPVAGVTEKSWIAVASTREAFADKLRRCVEGTHGLDLAVGVQYARERSWESQVPKLIDWLGLQKRQA